MLLMNKTFTVDLTEPEVQRITDALHLAYKENKKYLTRTDVLDHELQGIRSARNFFAGMIGTRYMGEDA